MAYTIPFSDIANKGTITVEDRTINEETSLGFLGRNTTAYGEVISQNFLHLLENFASDSPPVRPVQGQLWYDTGSGIQQLKIFDGNNWVSAAGVKKADTEAEIVGGVAGDLWVDTDNHQLYLYTGTQWVLVGPEYSNGLSTGAYATTITGTDNDEYVIIKFDVLNQPVAILGFNSFTPKVALAGFSTIKPGFNISSSNITGSGIIKYNGLAEVAESLRIDGLNVSADNFIRRDSIANFAFPVNIQHDTGLTLGANGALRVYVNANDVIFRNDIAGKGFDIETKQSGVPTSVIRILNDGKVGINKTNPEYKLDVAGDMRTSQTLRVDSTTESTSISTGSVIIKGGVGIAKTLNVGGDVVATGNVNTHNVIPASNNLYDIGTSVNKYNEVFATTFQGNVIGNVTGNVSGSAGTTNRLTNQTRFRIIGDINTLSDIIFDGDTGGLIKELNTQIVNGTITPNKIAAGDFYFDNNVLYIDSVNNRVGINTSTPAYDLHVVGNVHATGNITLEGNIILGNEPGDTVDFTGTINSDLKPATSELYDIGSATEKWADIYALTVNANLTGNVTGNINSTGTSTFSTLTVSNFTSTDTKVKIGSNAVTNGFYGIAIGTGSEQDGYGVTIGQDSQADSYGVTVGAFAGKKHVDNNTVYTVALGAFAQQNDNPGDITGIGAIAIGALAGDRNQGANSIAIGRYAGRNNQAEKSIVLNATDANLENTTANSLVIKPIRNDVGSTFLTYNSTSGEVTHGLPTADQLADILYDSVPQTGQVLKWDGTHWVPRSDNVGSGGGSGGEPFNLLVGADDSALRAIFSGESISFLGGTGISTTSDNEGAITISSVQTLQDVTDNGSVTTNFIAAAGFRGSLFADDSSTMVDAIQGKIVGDVLSNVVQGNNVIGTQVTTPVIILDDAVTNTITATSDLEIGAGSTLNLVSVTGNINLLPGAGQAATVDGNLEVTGVTYSRVTGDLTGSVFADDSSMIIDAVGNNVFTNSVTFSGGMSINDANNDFTFDASNGPTNIVLFKVSNGEVLINSEGVLTAESGLIGDLVGDVRGSVFADDSSLLIDAVAGKIVGPVESNVTGNLTGNVDGDLTGSIFADDSSLLVDGINRKFYGSLITSSISKTDAGTLSVQSKNEMSLVSTESDITIDSNIYRVRIKHNGFVTTFRSNGTIIIPSYIDGDLTGSVFGDDSTILVDAATSSIPGSVIRGRVTADVTGDLTGSVYADDSTLLIDGVAGKIVGQVEGDVIGNVTGNVTGNVVGDVTGSVFGDDSSVLVDGVNSKITGNVQNSSVQTTTLQASNVTISNLFTLPVLNSAPISPAEGTVAIADGIGWNPLGNYVKSMVVYLDSTWRQIATA